MCRLFECKYSFKTTFLWGKLECCTRVHEKDLSFVALDIIKSETPSYLLRTIIYYDCARVSRRK